MTEDRTSLKDWWTTNRKYRDRYQNDDQIARCLEQLDLGSAGALLDNACGNGRIARKAAEDYPHLRVYGFDVLESAIAECTEKAAGLSDDRVSFEVAWADDLPITGASVDRALLRNALHHIAAPTRVFSEVARVLVPGGKFLLQTPFNYWEDDFSRFLSELHWLMDDSHRRHYYTADEIRNGLVESDFTVVDHECHPYDFPSINSQQEELIRRHGHAERLALKQISEDRWTVSLYWVKFTSHKKKAKPNTP